ncbi:MAG: DUF1598 domain-containing protein [Planctomycetes bacterium]|nr:DUF1598 domain-containing protein [Planctomycetota bacterium]
MRTISGTHLLAPCLALLAAALVDFPDTASGQGTTVQLPTFGVSIDAEGVLNHKQVEDVGGQLQAARNAAAKQALPRNVVAISKLRKVSLTRLDAALRRRIDAGGQPDAAERHLAGLTRLRYLFLFPETHEIVIAGEAGGWVEDGAGRAVSLDNGRPVLELVDLCVALRMFRPGGREAPFIGCSIDPSPDAMARLQAFQRTVPRSVSQSERGQIAAQLDRGLRDALGNSNIQVFGISAKTHLAQVLIEADYRMKLIAIDLEPPPVRLVTYLGGLQSAPQGLVQRWWFQPDYDCVKVTKDRQGMELTGQGVQLLTENMAVGPGGKLINPNSRSSGASERFAKSFTTRYPEIAARSPVYAQMRNGIDLLVVAAYMAREGFYEKAEWDQGVLGDEKTIPTETLPAPKHAPCAVNVVWKGSRLLAPAGGVSIVPTNALDPARVEQDKDGQLAAKRESTSRPQAAERWWWD